MKRVLTLFLFVLLVPISAYARTEPVRATEGDITVPYTPLGTLEVKKKVGGVSDLGWGALRVMTLGFYKSSPGERYRQALRALLVHKAAKHYGANAVIHVKYWPNPDSGIFPKGILYARGEMVRYKPFPEQS